MRSARRRIVVSFIARSAAVLLAGALLLPGCGDSTTDGSVVADPTSHPWREDLDVFARELPKRHKDLFFSLERSRFEELVRDLDRRAPELSEAEFTLELRPILAAIGDAHTNLSFDFSVVYPFSLQVFEEGIYCTGALPEHREVIGARLLSVDGSTPEAITRLARAITPHDNASQIAMFAPIYLLMPELLVAAELTEQPEQATFVFQSSEGVIEITMNARAQESMADLEPDDFARPLYRRQPESNYWLTSDPDRSLVYMQYNVCREDPERPMERFATELMTRISETDPRRVVIDLRNNTGGSSPVLHPLIDRLIADYNDGRDYELYVVIGRETFSSAVLNAINLKQNADAIFVGEPSGGRPNHFGEVRSFDLPNSGRQVRYSTKYFTHYQPADGSDPDALMPDIPAAPTWELYRQGVDPALRAIMAHEPSG